MSEEDAKAFLKKVGEDKELQEKIKGADSEEKFFAVVKGAGFDFTKEEWLSVLPKKKDGDLSEDNFAEASGGAWTEDLPHRPHCCSFLSLSTHNNNVFDC